ncbi:hypothetical protein BVX93_01600 [bacterium B13(2017)]|nr:hypothetical protein BVX93_01600 [bacterium B13(2017)]
MEILRTLALYSEAKNEKFILIGGHALNFYGYTRQTSDIDFIVPKSHKTYWNGIFQRLKYKCNQDDDRFSRYHPENLIGWPIDLMYVDDETFEKLYNESNKGKIAEIEVQVVSALHLALLKLHSLKHFQEHRFAKDFQDLTWIFQNKIKNISDEELKVFCEKYANIDLFYKLKQVLR